MANWKPLPWQIAPWRDKSPSLLLTGSAGGGKSRLAAEKIHGYCMKYPGATWLMLRKAREWTTRSIVAFYAQTVVGPTGGVRFNRSEGAFYYANGSTVYSGGMLDDKQREAVRSIGAAGGLDGIWLEEANAFTRTDFEECLGRLRHTAADWQQAILTTNPDSPAHWIYTDLIQGGQAAVYYSHAADNPYNAPAYTENLARLTGILKDRLVEGRWVQAEGAVYPDYDPALHVINPFAIPPDWKRYRAIDFGFNNPFTCQWWAQDPDGTLYLYREIYHTRKLCEDLAKEIVRLSSGEKFVISYADHDSEDRATLERYGVRTQPATKDVSPGIQAVGARLRVQANGKPRLLLLRGALVKVDPELEAAKRPLCLQDEFPAYSWPRGIDGKAAREAPVKDNDHGMDAMRYLVYGIDNVRRGVLVGKPRS